MRTATDHRHLLEYARRPNVGFVGEPEGGFIFPEFQPAFDAMYSIAHILEMLAERGTGLSEIRSQIPEKPNVLHRRVPCSWGKKGQVMRLAQRVSKDYKVELIDGVKIHFVNGWVLVLPDPNEAYCHIWVETTTDADAKKILDEYTQKVEQWQKVDEGLVKSPYEAPIKMD